MTQLSQEYYEREFYNMTKPENPLRPQERHVEEQIINLADTAQSNLYLWLEHETPFSPEGLELLTRAGESLNEIEVRRKQLMDLYDMSERAHFIMKTQARLWPTPGTGKE